MVLRVLLAAFKFVFCFLLNKLHENPDLLKFTSIDSVFLIIDNDNEYRKLSAFPLLTKAHEILNINNSTILKFNYLLF